MVNKPKGYGTWDAALGLILCGLAVLLFLALVSYQPGDLPAWAKLIYDTNARSPIVHTSAVLSGPSQRVTSISFLERPPISGSSYSLDTASPS